MKVAEFQVVDSTGDPKAVIGEVHITDSGTLRLELPGYWYIKSVYPGSGGNDKMNVNLVPVPWEDEA
jgi:hypothetical protein